MLLSPCNTHVLQATGWELIEILITENLIMEATGERLDVVD